VSDIIPPLVVTTTTKEIPYDYVAKFNLKGVAGNRVQDVINISIEGGFVAVAIGYSFIPAKLAPPAQDGSIARTPFSADVPGLINSILFFEKDPRTLAQCLLVRLCGIDFKYSIVDSGTGRELQNQPIHNLAGLGEATGERPFRPLAKPMLFMPRSTIRIEVQEISEGPLYSNAELFIVMQGYKILGYGTGQP
jgi:hypothetical protein